MANTPPYTMRLPVEQRQALEALAQKSGLSIAELIQMCIKRALPYVEGLVDGKLAAQPPQP